MVTIKIHTFVFWSATGTHNEKRLQELFYPSKPELVPVLPWGKDRVKLSVEKASKKVYLYEQMKMRVSKHAYLFVNIYLQFADISVNLTEIYEQFRGENR